MAAVEEVGTDIVVVIVTPPVTNTVEAATEVLKVVVPDLEARDDVDATEVAEALVTLE